MREPQVRDAQLGEPRVVLERGDDGHKVSGDGTGIVVIAWQTAEAMVVTERIPQS